jgi:hypothetical protein
MSSNGRQYLKVASMLRCPAKPMTVRWSMPLRIKIVM